MKRIGITPRNNWQEAVEKLGFGFHTANIPYWDESVYYELSMSEVSEIEKATAALWNLCLEAVQHVIDNRLYHLFNIPEWFIPYIKKTWNDDHPSIYGRFDLCVKDGQVKLLEFNADTPTSIYESAIVQWFWLQDFNKDKDQFNSVHEKLVEYWSYLKKYFHAAPLHFTCLKETLEDLTNVEYMRDCAIQAGLETKLIFVDDIGWDEHSRQFFDLEDHPIKNIFKLYPWEWMVSEEFGQNILLDVNRAFWVEPSWKMLLSNKAILPVLWQLNPDHAYLLPAYFEADKLSAFVKKPLLSREGANINIVKDGELLQFTEGEYGKEGYIYQQLFELPDFNGHYPMIGSWIVGQQAAGIGIREANSLITDNVSRFVPHLIG
ncbi:MAG TPA: glutathionylspermidine synthase family protein [Segetibacter sp.]